MVVPVPPQSHPYSLDPRSAGVVAGVAAALSGTEVNAEPSTALLIPFTVAVTAPFASVSIFCTYLEPTPLSQPQLLAIPPNEPNPENRD
jgi:hypothetical protein